jgi:hypothetical protein
MPPFLTRGNFMGEETAKSPFFVSDFVLKRKTLRQCYECRGGKEMSKVA